MSATTIESTVGQFVVDRPSTARTFEQLGIDYCCGGKKPLAQACREKGIDPEVVFREIQSIPSTTQERNWADAAMSELCDHIVATHHAYLRTELPRIDMLSEKVARAHGANHPEVVQVRQTFLNLQTEMNAHMMKEEQVLFPMIRQLDGAKVRPGFHCGSVGNPIRVMIMEHESAGAALEQFHNLTGGYTAPADACNTYRALLDALATLERDMHQHVHKENNILFPRAIEAEARLGN